MQQLPQPGDRLGAYVLEEVLAAGAQGSVYRGRHASLGTPVAVKVLHAPDPTTLARFQREARTLASLRHPSLVRVEDLGRSPGGVCYLVMDLVEGQTLHDRVRLGGVLSAKEAVDLLAPVAEVLGHCHSLGILHRDVKPENILLSSGGPLLVDFGLVRRDPTSGAPTGEAEAQRLTQTGEIVGTPSYMAPEQADGGRAAILPACDVYGLGATLYFGLTGEAPFDGGSLFATLNKVLNDPPPDPRERCPVPAALAELCLASLAKDPRARPSTEEFSRGLREGPQAPEGSRSRVIALGALALGLLVLVGGLGLALSVRSEAPRSDSPPARTALEPTSAPSQSPQPAEVAPTAATASPPAPRASASIPPQGELPPLPQTWRQIGALGRRWTPRRQPSAVAWKGRLWVFPEAGDALRLQGGIYSSRDLGETWERIGFKGRGAASSPQRTGSLIHKGELYRLGGFASGETTPSVRRTFMSVRMSFDGSLLRMGVLGPSPDPYSRDMNGVSFKGKTYVLGATSIDPNHKGPELYSNVAYRMIRAGSLLNFKEIRRPEWGPRYGARVLAYRRRIWVLGGRLHDPGVKPRHCDEVWSTKNPAKGWKQVKVEKPFPATGHFGACVWRGRMWLGGGATTRSGPMVLWHSVDGVRWEALKLEGAPPTRSSTSLVALDEDRLILVGGQVPGTGGSSTKTTNDVWVLR